MKKLITIMIVAVILTAATNVIAVPIMAGEPYTGNSWSFPAIASGIGLYNLAAVRIASGSDVFESPAISNISNPNWGLVLDGPTLASWSGPAVTSLSWTTTLAGDLPMSQPLELDWAFFNDGQLTAWTHWNMNINGGLVNWTLNPSDGWKPKQADVIPEPATLLLLGIGGIFLRRRK